MPQFNMSSQVGARFRFVKHTGNPDEPNFDSGWHNNLVLDSGLARMSVGNYAEYIVLGASGDIPDVAQTGLISYLGYSSTQYGTDTTFVNTTAEPYYTSVTRTFRVPAGTATGSIAEAGLGWYKSPNNGTESDARNSCFNRVLIKDNLGAPTTIQKLADEVLDVLVELRYYPEKNVNTTFNLTTDGGAPVTITATGNAILNNVGWPTGNVIVSQVEYIPNDDVNYPYIDDYTSARWTGSWSGAESLANTNPTTTSVNVEATSGLTYNNYEIKTIQVHFANIVTHGSSGVIPGGYKFTVSPTITKDATKVLKMNFGLSWSRYVP